MKGVRFFTTAILICVAIYIGVFIGRNTESGTIRLPYSQENKEIKVINLNTATTDDLCTLPGVGPKLAASIIEYREKYGDFVYVKELLHVYGMSKDLFDSIKDYVTVDG